MFQNQPITQKYLNEDVLLDDLEKIDRTGPIVSNLLFRVNKLCHGAIIPVDAGQSKHFYVFLITWNKK